MRAHRGARLATLVVAACALFAATAASAASQRTFVSRTGIDSNPCSFTLPCRSFTAAIVQTSPGGEVVVLDSAGYGPVTITQSVSIVAPAGIYAGVSVLAADGITINAGATDIVRLRGLTITGVGGARGIVATSVGLLDVANVEVSGFTNRGLDFAAPGGQLAVADSAFVGNGGDGVRVESAAAKNFATVSRARFDRNDNGIVIGANAFGTVADSSASYNVTNNVLVTSGGAASVTDCSITGSDVYGSSWGVAVTNGAVADVARCRMTGGSFGVIAYGVGAKVAVADTTVVAATGGGITASAGAEATAERCTVIASLHGMGVGGGNSLLRVSNSTIVDNTSDAFQLYAAGSVIESRQNNTVRGNAAFSSGPGTFTTFGPN
jgi:hypothetical protein